MTSDTMTDRMTAACDLLETLGRLDSGAARAVADIALTRAELLDAAATCEDGALADDLGAAARELDAALAAIERRTPVGHRAG